MIGVALRVSLRPEHPDLKDSCCTLQVALHYWSAQHWAVRQRASVAVRILDTGQLTVGELLRIPEMVLGIERSGTLTPDAASESVCIVLPTCHQSCWGAPAGISWINEPAEFT